MFRNATKLQQFKSLQFQLQLLRNTRNPVRGQCPRNVTTCPPKKPVDYFPKECPPPSNKKPISTGFGATVGALALLTGAVISFAKYDDEFRQWMDERVPNFSSMVGFIFQEEKSFYDRLGDLVSSIKSSFNEGIESCVEAPYEKPSFIKEEVVPYTAPRSAFHVLLSGDFQTIPGRSCVEPYQEIRAIYPDDERIETLQPILSGENEQPVGFVLPQEAFDIETQIGAAAKTAVENYQNAINLIRELSGKILDMIETEPSKLKPDVWPTIKEKSKEQTHLLKTGDEAAATAVRLGEELNKMEDQNRLPGPVAVRAKALKNTKRMLKDIEQAKQQVNRELHESGIAKNAWDRVIMGREKWQKIAVKFYRIGNLATLLRTNARALESISDVQEEISILVPGALMDEKSFNMVEEELAQFAYHAYVNIQYYLKELALLEMGSEVRLKEALDAAHKGNIEPLVNIFVADKVAEERRKLDVLLAKKTFELRINCAREIKLQLKANSELEIEHLAESLRLLEAEELREHNRRLGEALATEAFSYRVAIASIVGRVKGIDEGLKEHAAVDKRAHQAQDFWAMCQLFLRRLDAAVASGQLTSIDSIVKTIDSQAGDTDALVRAVIKGIPTEAVSRGIYSTSTLVERFFKVEKVARTLGAVESESVSLVTFFFSWLQSRMLFQNKFPLSPEERHDEPTQIDLLDNYGILSRARYWMLRGDIPQTLRYMNLLKGASRCICEDWMKEARLHLECKQAALALVSHATALGMMYS